MDYYYLLHIEWCSYDNQNKYDFNENINSDTLLNVTISDQVNTLLLTYNI